MHQLLELKILEDKLTEAVQADDIEMVRNIDSKITAEFGELIQQVPASKAELVELVDYLLTMAEPDCSAGGQFNRIRDRILSLLEMSFELPQ